MTIAMKTGAKQGLEFRIGRKVQIILERDYYHNKEGVVVGIDNTKVGVQFQGAYGEETVWFLPENLAAI